MAVTMNINKKIQRLDLIKTALSYGWTVGPLMIDNLNNMGDKIGNANIKIFLVHGSIDKNNFVVTYQPEMDQLTVASKDDETETRIKDEVTCIFENMETGTFMLNDPTNYMDNLVKHSQYLTVDEYSSLIKEAEEKYQNLNYFG